MRTSLVLPYMLGLDVIPFFHKHVFVVVVVVFFFSFFLLIAFQILHVFLPDILVH
jgi:hypothetical protein